MILQKKEKFLTQQVLRSSWLEARPKRWQFPKALSKQEVLQLLEAKVRIGEYRLRRLSVLDKSNNRLTFQKNNEFLLILIHLNKFKCYNLNENIFKSTTKNENYNMSNVFKSQKLRLMSFFDCLHKRCLFYKMFQDTIKE